MGCSGSKEAVEATVTKQEEYEKMLKEINSKGGGALNNVDKPLAGDDGQAIHHLAAKPLNTEDTKNPSPTTPVRLEGNCKYLGEWKDGKKHGRGKQLFSTGSYYEGEWALGSATGKGVMYSCLPGDKWIKYTGAFVNNVYHGAGNLEFNDGGVMTGNHVNGLKSGKWLEKFSGGSQFEGNYENGVRCGIGKYTFPDGCEYHGMFESGQMRGWGRHEWPDGRVYKGEWLDAGNGQMHGIGAFYWPGGRKYVGQYESGKKQGFGIFVWPEGKSYRGYWHNGFQEGFAEFKHQSGDTRFGIWQGGKRLEWLKSSQVKEACANLGQSSTLQTEDELLSNMPAWLKELPAVVDNSRPAVAGDESAKQVAGPGSFDG